MKKNFAYIIVLLFIAGLLPAASIAQAQCNALFAVYPSCLGTSTTFIDSSFVGTQPGTDTVVQEIWNYGDGKKDTFYHASYSFTHMYAQAGFYTVSFNVYTENGCSSTSTRVVAVYPKPAASFTPSNDTVGCAPFTINFSNTTSPGDSISSYIWNFGDGSSVNNIQNVTHTFLATSNTSLIVQSKYGCKDTVTAFYNVVPPPVAGFSYQVDSTKQRTIQFTDTSKISGGAIFHWNFGDGTTSTLGSPSHTYSHTGTDTVTLNVVASAGCSSTVTHVINVDSIGISCHASFSTNTVCRSVANTFIDASTVAVDSLVKEIWNYGDGKTDTLFTGFNTAHTHLYTSSGVYNTTLKIFSAEGCSSAFAATATVRTVPVADSFYYTQTPCENGAYDVQFFLNNKNIVGTLQDIWTFGDGIKESNIPDSVVLHTYAVPGNYSVQLVARVSSCNAFADTAVKLVKVYGPPVANFNFTQDTGTSKRIVFNDLSNGGQSPATSWSWNFGDGDTSILQNPSHIYAAAGNYIVNLGISTGLGCTSNFVSHQVYVDSSYTVATSSGYQSNFGNDFWAGFGYEEKMAQRTSVGGATTEFYIVGGSHTSIVTISLPGLPTASGFPMVVVVPADSEVTVTGFPMGDPNDITDAAGLPDTRLYYTGVSNRAIHISASQPVAVWQHIYALNNSAGATLLVPANIWSNNYTVQTIGGLSNAGIPNSFFYVIPQEDSTQINFTPSSDIIDSVASFINSPSAPASILYHAGLQYSITLNKGQVFNAMSAILGNNAGADLSATTVNSPDPTKKIAVFAGNGRVLINTAACNNVTGSDNLIQQMFPQIAWGTKYLTVPTKTMEYNIYRITVTDSTTAVTVNGNTLPLSSLIQHSYYQIESNTPNIITGNKKIMVTQYIVSPGCPTFTQGNNGSGDPEMIILSPVDFASNNLSIYSSNMIITGGASYINVVIKKTGINSFTLDGMNTADTGTNSFQAANPYGTGGTIPAATAFRPHPGDSSYYYATFKVSYPALHTLSSDSSFSAIAYGLSPGESYGYNAGFTLNYQHIVYTFTGNGKWSDQSNWSNNTPPPHDLQLGSEIIISGNCTLDVQQTLEQGATLTVLNGANFIVGKNLLIQE